MITNIEHLLALISEGSIVAIEGASGAGKSTLVRRCLSRWPDAEYLEDVVLDPDLLESPTLGQAVFCVQDAIKSGRSISAVQTGRKALIERYELSVVAHHVSTDSPALPEVLRLRERMRTAGLLVNPDLCVVVHRDLSDLVAEDHARGWMRPEELIRRDHDFYENETGLDRWLPGVPIVHFREIRT